jgi:hypothetical protein
MRQVADFLTRDIISFRWLCAKLIRLLLMPIAWLVDSLLNWVTSFDSNPSRSIEGATGRRNRFAATRDDDFDQFWSTSGDELFDGGFSRMTCAVCGRVCIGGVCTHDNWSCDMNNFDPSVSTGFDDQASDHPTTGHIDFD